MKDPVLSHLENELAEAVRRVPELQKQIAARRSYLGLSAEAAPAAQKRPAVQNAGKQKRRTRAQPGAIDAAILQALGDGEELTNQQIRAKLAASGYKHSLTPSHVSGELGRMAKMGKLVMRKNGSNSTYRKPAPAGTREQALATLATA